jgi:hypothetical protein
MVDTIGTSYLDDGCLRLRADWAKVNRSAHGMDKLDSTA